MRIAFLLMCTTFFYGEVCAQRRIDFTKPLYLSIVPGFGTNGFHPGGYTNLISLHLTSGYSASNRLLEIAGISNLNTQGTSGIQIATLSNFTGSNAFAGLEYDEQTQLMRQGFEANLIGAQISGLTNAVLTNVFGWQATGGFNVAKGALFGFQLAGMANIVHKYSFGLQFAGISNVSYQSMDGVQLASISNYTHGGLYGLQVGAFNKADFMEGKNSFQNDGPSGVQIGVINVARRMNGMQLGLLNVAKTSQGTQIGLVNLYKGGRMVGTKNGIAVGLLNLGQSEYLAVYANELFYTNIELSTGTFRNYRIESDTKSEYLMNSLIYSNDIGLIDGSRKKWGFGYGLKKYYFSRSGLAYMNHFRFISIGTEFIHLNHEVKKLTKELSLIVKPTLSIGTRVHQRLRWFYVFGALSLNAYWTTTNENGSNFLDTSISLDKSVIHLWPGFSVGTLLF